MGDHFEAIVLIGRPAAGKGAVVDYLRSLDPVSRARQFRVATPEVLSDLPYLWQALENDDIRSRFGKARLHSTESYALKDPWFWSYLIERLGTDCRKRLLRDPEWFADHTGFVKFARGGDNAYDEALGYLCDAILSRAGIVYVDVPPEAAATRVRSRWPGPDEVLLSRPLPPGAFAELFRADDWRRLTQDQPDGYVQVKSHRVPFAVLKNEPEVTRSPEILAPALEETLRRLWKRLRAR
jgi:hypothetical protein